MHFQAMAFLLLFHGSAELFAGETARWEYLSDQDGIKVYRREVSGSPVLELRGEGLVSGSLTHIFSVFKDASRYHEWAPAVRAKRVLNQHYGPLSRVEYTHVGLPWPLSDRYFVTEGRAELHDSGVLYLSSRSIDDHRHLETGKIKGYLHFSEAILEPIDHDSTRVTVIIGMDPKGSLPGWLVNWSQRNWPYKFIRGLREQVAKADIKPEPLPAASTSSGPMLMPAAEFLP